MRNVLVILALLAVAASLWLLWDSRSPPASNAATPAGSVASRSPEDQPAAPEAPVPATQHLAAERAPEPEMPVVASEGTPEGSLEAPAEGMVRVHGTVVVVDPDGFAHREEDGELELTLWNDRTGSHARAEVQGGRFTVDVPEDREIEVDRAELGGRPAFVDEQRHPPTPALTIQARWVASTLLRVVDSASGADLHDVRIVRSHSWVSEDSRHPGDEATRILARGSSPLLLDYAGERRNHGGETIWVGSPGYAWQRLRIDLAQAAERRCELHRGAALEVRIEGALPEGDPMLRLRSPPEVPEIDLALAMRQLAALPDSVFPEGRPTEEQVAEALRAERDERAPEPGDMVLEVGLDGELPRGLLVEDVDPGSYRVTVELGDHWESRILAERSVVLEPDRPTRVTLHVLPPPAEVVVPLSGTLSVPPEWGPADSLSLWFEVLDHPGAASRHEGRISLSWIHASGGTPGLYRWHAGNVVQGRYEIRCHALDSSWVVDTGPRGRDDVELVIAPPATVAVTVIDAASGRVLEGLELSWSRQGSDGAGSGGSGRAAWNPSTGAHEFRAPAGTVSLRVRQEEYRVAWTPEDPFGEASHELTPGHHEITLRVERSCGLIVWLRDGPTPIPWDEFFAVELEPLDGSGFLAEGGTCEDHGQYFTVTEPGRYRVTIPLLPGYAPVAPFEVEIPQGQLLEHVVALQPLE